MASNDDIMRKLDKLDSIESSIQDLRNTCESINVRTTIIETQTENNTTSIEGLQGNLDQLQSEVNKLQYEKIHNNVIIYGIPYQKEEDIQQLTIQICNRLINTPIDSNCIRTRRMPIKSISPPIVVSFRDYNTKVSILSNWKSLRNDQSANNIQKRLKDELNILPTNIKISIIEEQTPYIIELFKEAKQLLGSRFKFIWIKYGNIYLREKELAPIHKIGNRTQLYQFKEFQQDAEEDQTITE